MRYYTDGKTALIRGVEQRAKRLGSQIFDGVI